VRRLVEGAPDSVLAALGIAKPEDVELEVVAEDLGQGETETRYRYQWTEGGRSDPGRRRQERDLQRRHALFDLCSGCDRRR
jgi:hypothetical protein